MLFTYPPEGVLAAAHVVQVYDHMCVNECGDKKSNSAIFFDGCLVYPIRQGCLLKPGAH